MQRNATRKIDYTLLAVKRLAATFAIVVFGLSAILGFGVALVEFVAEALNSTKAGTLGGPKTVADMWPFISAYVAAIEWGSLQRIGLWVITQSVVWAYLGLGVLCFAICGLFMEVYDSLEQRHRWRLSLENRRLARNA
jgi:hypothetical protein